MRFRIFLLLFFNCWSIQIQSFGNVKNQPTENRAFNCLNFENEGDLLGSNYFMHRDFEEDGDFCSQNLKNEILIQYSNFKKKLSFTEHTFSKFVIADSKFEEVNINQIEVNHYLAIARSIFNGNCHIDNSSYKKFDFQDNTFKRRLRFNTVDFESKARFSSVKFDSKVFFTNCNIESASFHGSSFGEELVFRNINIKNIIDLTGVIPNKNNKHCYLTIVETPLDKIKFNYGYFKIKLPEIKTNHDFAKSIRLYEDYIQKFENEKEEYSLELLKKEYIEFKLTKNPRLGSFGLLFGKILVFSKKYWNDFGYDRSLIWQNTFLLFISIFIINFLFLDFFIKQVYCLPELLDSYTNSMTNRHKRNLSNILTTVFQKSKICFFYTAFLFFGLKLKIENLNFNYQLAIFFILAQYVIGIVCLAYLANMVIAN